MVLGAAGSLLGGLFGGGGGGGGKDGQSGSNATAHQKQDVGTNSNSTSNASSTGGTGTSSASASPNIHFVTNIGIEQQSRAETKTEQKQDNVQAQEQENKQLQENTQSQEQKQMQTVQPAAGGGVAPPAAGGGAAPQHGIDKHISNVTKDIDDIVATLRNANAENEARKEENRALREHLTTEKDALVALITGMQERMAALESQVATLKQNQMPIGTVIASTASNPPDGFLLCDGTAVPFDVKYQPLVRALQAAGGFTDANGTILLPNIEGKVIVGAGTTYALGVVGGSAKTDVTLATPNMPIHNHGGQTEWGLAQNYRIVDPLNPGSRGLLTNVVAGDPNTHLKHVSGWYDGNCKDMSDANWPGAHFKHKINAEGQGNPFSVDVMQPFTALNHYIKY